MAALGALAPAGLSPQYGEGKNGCRGPIGLSQLPPAHNSHFPVSHYGLCKACGGGESTKALCRPHKCSVKARGGGAGRVGRGGWGAFTEHL